ncbi:hypothetical protein AX16_002706 [Volvariella volvacea WC 439]|nr:hypothetical protein AX16_002706 [Volvariella volvacea WC 439]
MEVDAKDVVRDVEGHINGGGWDECGETEQWNGALGCIYIYLVNRRSPGTFPTGAPMPAPEPPPAPSHLLRSHPAPVHVLSISDDNERIYSGDASGIVIVTSTRSLRPVTSWKAHDGPLLGIQEWGRRLITHARDNKLHVWEQTAEAEPAIRPGGSAAVLETPKPKLCYSMDVNALNFCRFSLLPVPPGEASGSTEVEPRALIALPNLIDSDVADIWQLPSQDRIHAAVGEQEKESPRVDGTRNTTGIIMAMHLYQASLNNTSGAAESSSTALLKELRLLCAYENGTVVLRRYVSSKLKSIQGLGWEVLWKAKLHVETIMAMKVAKDNSFALSVSADHIVGRYDLSSGPDGLREPQRTKHPGNGCIAIRDDGKVCAIGGWDGKIRLYSTKNFKPLGTLSYHKQALQALEFAHSPEAHSPEGTSGRDEQVTDLVDEEDDDEEYGEADREKRARWLIAGSKDNRITIWSLISFQKGQT